LPSEGQSIRLESTIEEGEHDSDSELELDISGYSELGGGSEKVVDVAVIAKVGEVTAESEAEQGASSAVGGARGGTTAELDDANDDDDADEQDGGRDDEEGGVDDESGLVVDGTEPPPLLPLLT
jgi:hypothetical protein